MKMWWHFLVFLCSITDTHGLNNCLKKTALMPMPRNRQNESIEDSGNEMVRNISEQLGVPTQFKENIGPL